MKTQNTQKLLHQLAQRVVEREAVAKAEFEENERQCRLAMGAKVIGKIIIQPSCGKQIFVSK